MRKDRRKGQYVTPFMFVDIYQSYVMKEQKRFTLPPTLKVDVVQAHLEICVCVRVCVD